MKETSYYQEQLEECKGFTVPSILILLIRGFWLIVPLLFVAYYSGQKLLAVFGRYPYRFRNYFETFLFFGFFAVLIGFVFDRPWAKNDLKKRSIKMLAALVPTILFFLFLRHYNNKGLTIFPEGHGNIELFYRVADPVVIGYLMAIVALFLGIKLLWYVFRDGRETANASAGHFKWAHNQVTSQMSRIKELLNYDEEIKLILAEPNSSPMHPENSALVMLAICYSMAHLTMAAALTSAGEGLTILSNFIFVPFVLLSLLLFPKDRNHLRFGALPIMVCLLLSYTFLESVSAVQWMVLFFTVLISIPLCRLIWLDFQRWLRRRFLVVTNERVVILHPQATDENSLIEIESGKCPLATEDCVFTLLHFSTKKETALQPFAVASFAELNKLIEVGPPAFAELKNERPTPFWGWKAMPSLLVFVLAISWSFYSTICMGLGLGMTTIVEIAHWTEGKSAQMYQDQKRMMRYFPWCAAMSMFQAMAAADTENYDDAIIAFKDAALLSLREGQVGKLIKTGEEEKFVEFCKKAKGLQTLVRKLKVPRGANIAAFREIEYARRYVDLSKNCASLLMARKRNVVKHLRNAVEMSGNTYPQAKLELVRALACTGIYEKFDEKGQHYLNQDRCDLEALELLEQIRNRLSTSEYDDLHELLSTRAPKVSDVDKIEFEFRTKYTKTNILLQRDGESHYSMRAARCGYAIEKDDLGRITGTKYVSGEKEPKPEKVKIDMNGDLFLSLAKEILPMAVKFEKPSGFSYPLELRCKVFRGKKRNEVLISDKLPKEWEAMRKRILKLSGKPEEVK